MKFALSVLGTKLMHKQN